MAIEQQYPQIILKPKKSAALSRRHPWIFSGAILKQTDAIQEGAIVEVYSHKGQYLATGHYQVGGSISVRIFSFEKVICDAKFWKSKIQTAFAYRQALGFPNAATNVFRLVNGEGDGMPGLILDYYNGTVVLQAHSAGMYLLKMELVSALKTVLGKHLKAVYDKSAETLPSKVMGELQNDYLDGTSAPGVVLENGKQFFVDWERGQKTGFFIDQRDNRQYLSQLTKDKKVLNAFCYSGGFSIYALQAGAALVHSADSSAKAIDWTNQNVALNGLEEANHEAIITDVYKHLNETTQSYNFIILDPPAYAKSFKARHKAVQGYKRLNAKALQKIESGGYLFTFSCSGVVDQALFFDTIRAAAIEVKREVRVVRQVGPAICHPINIYHPEGAYLKGLLLHVK